MPIFTFILSKWRVFVPLALLLVAFIHYNAIVNDRDNAIQALNDYKYEQYILSKQQKFEQDVNLAKANHAISVEKSKADQLKKEFSLERARLEKDLRKLYERKINTLKRNMGSVPERLLQQVGSSNSAETTSDSRELAEGESIDYPSAYRTLEDACRITTIDYNQARAWIDVVCNLYECSDK